MLIFDQLCIILGILLAYQINVVTSESCLWPKHKLSVGKCLQSKDYYTAFSACFTKTGQICVSSSRTPTWCTNSSSPAPAFASFDEFGSLYLYNTNGEVYYKVYERQNTRIVEDNYLIIQPDGNLAIYAYKNDEIYKTTPHYECSDYNCKTVKCRDCDDHTCTNKRHGPYTIGVNTTIILCIALPIMAIIIAKVLYSFVYLRRYKQHLPVATDVQVVTPSIATAYEPVSIEMTEVSDLESPATRIPGAAVVSARTASVVVDGHIVVTSL